MVNAKELAVWRQSESIQTTCGCEIFSFSKVLYKSYIFYCKTPRKALDNSCKSWLNYLFNLFDFFYFCEYLGYSKKKKIIQIRIDQINYEYCCNTFPRKKCKIDHMFGSESLKSRHFFGKVKTYTTFTMNSLWNDTHFPGWIVKEMEFYMK